MLRRMGLEDVAARAEARRGAVDADTLQQARVIVDDVAQGGEAALLRWAEQLGDWQPGQPWVLGREALQAALDAIDPEVRGVLERTAARIERFATAQRQAVTEIDLPIEGGIVGHRLAPVERAGCYAPGGRYPLPSSVLMTAVTARAAGVQQVWVASPRPAAVTLAAAAVAGADGVLAIGGAQAVAALAFGAGPVPAVDVVCGPGNRWVTAAKQLVAGRVGIDLLAGPSELMVIADGSADPEVVASDLLAQAEHDEDAVVWLVTPSERLAEAVDAALARQLETLPTAAVARTALAQGAAIVVADWAQACEVADAVAPEHLELLGEGAEQLESELRHWGGLFVGSGAAEVLGDYGAGPNHTLPTGGTARFSGGLSVFQFLRIRTVMKLDAPSAVLVDDAVALASLEGLQAHGRSAARRRSG
ncbi:MAG: histidinol dehydrogenase [Myxococcales bacterium]|nr:histidinol dehydrogenase [Myxococcales bacterium]